MNNLFGQVWDLIPPHIAIRAVAHKCYAKASVAKKIRDGKRSVIAKALYSLNKREEIEIRRDDKGHYGWIRLKPN